MVGEVDMATKKKKQESSRGPDWTDYYERKTKTKREKVIAEERKKKQKERNDIFREGGQNE